VRPSGEGREQGVAGPARGQAHLPEGRASPPVPHPSLPPQGEKECESVRQQGSLDSTFVVIGRSEGRVYVDRSCRASDAKSGVAPALGEALPMRIARAPASIAQAQHSVLSSMTSASAGSMPAWAKTRR
jgi:hypothetical protein